MRPELKQSDLSIEINKLDARLSRELAKPRIDAFANASLAGLSGVAASQAANPITGAFGGLITQLNELSALAGVPPLDTSLFASAVPPNLIGGYGQSWNNIGAGTFPTVQVGLQISLPIRNRTAQANAAIAAAEGKRLCALRDQAEMLIEADVRNSLQTASSAQARYAASVLARAIRRRTVRERRTPVSVRHLDRIPGAAASDRSHHRANPRSARAGRPRGSRREPRSRHGQHA